MLQDGGRSPSACWLAREQTAPERRHPGPARPGPARQNPAQNPAGAPEAAPRGGADAAPRPHDGCLRAARDGTELTTGRTAGDGVRGPVRMVQAAATAPTQLLTAESGRSRLTRVKYTTGFRHVVLKNGRQLANVSYRFDVETVTFVSVLGYVKCIKINFHCFSFRLNDLAFKLSGPRPLTPRREGEPARSPPRAITRLKGNGNAFLEKAQRRADERRPCSSRPAAASEARGVRKHSNCCGDCVSPQPPAPPPLPVDEGGAHWSPWGAWPPGPLRPHAAPAAGGSGSEARPPGPEPGPAPTVWPWPQSPHFAVARSPRLRDRAKAGGEVTPGARGASRTGGRGRHQRPPNSVCGQPAQPPSLPALLLVAASSQCRNPQRDACATRLCRARTALRRLPRASRRGAQSPGLRTEAFERKERPQDRPGTELPGGWPQARVRLGPTAEPSAVCGGNSRSPVLRALT